LAAVGCTEFGRHPTTPAAPKSCARAPSSSWCLPRV